MELGLAMIVLGAPVAIWGNDYLYNKLFFWSGFRHSVGGCHASLWRKRGRLILTTEALALGIICGLYLPPEYGWIVGVACSTLIVATGIFGVGLWFKDRNPPRENLPHWELLLKAAEKQALEHQAAFAEENTMMALYHLDQYGPEDEGVGLNLSDLAMVFAGQPLLASTACAMYKRAWLIFQRSLGAEHPKTIYAKRNYIAHLRAHGREEEADKLENRNRYRSAP